MMSKRLRTVFCCFAVFLSACLLLGDPAISDDSISGRIPLNQHGVRSSNPYVVNRFIYNGKTIDEVIFPGQPNPPKAFSREAASVPEPDVAAGTNAISLVPAMTWVFGCSATSAAMMFGHYDNAGYPNMYTGPTNGGVFPMTNAIWGTVVINGETRALCPLSATRLGLDGRAVKGHVDDYWIRTGDPGPDPFIGNWEQHTYGECTGDYMGTNQSLLENVDGNTKFYFYPNGDPIYDYKDSEPAKRDGCHGLRLFVESRGYTVQTLGNFSQYIYGYDGNTKGFTFDDFKAEIDAGRPVLVHVTGHTMLAYGYDDIGSTVYMHDAWDYNDHSMTWGGVYSGMQHYGVSVLRLEAAIPTPPVAPTLSVSTSGITVTVSWTPIANATGYELAYAPVPYTGPESIKWADVGSRTEPLSVDLWSGADFWVSIRAYNSAGFSGYALPPKRVTIE
jgi:hypothetical protein